MKGRATNEQLAKVLEYTLSEHQKNIEKSEKERTIFLNDFKSQIESIKSIKLKPDLTEFNQLNEQLERECVNGAENIKSSFKNVYFSSLVLGIVFFVFISGLAMFVYGFKQIQKADEVAEAKETALANYFSKFLRENPKADESFKIWKEKK